jgi:hypothetical protein
MKKILLKSFTIFVFGILLSFVSLNHAQAQLPQDIQQKIESAAKKIDKADNEDSELEAFAQIVAALAKENPDLVGDIVSAAIKASGASNKLVGMIVEAVGTALPGSLSTIVFSASIAAPDAIAEINSAGAKVAVAANIIFIPVADLLDFGGGQDPFFGTNPGFNGGFPSTPEPPVVTDPDPSENPDPAET